MSDCPFCGGRWSVVGGRLQRRSLRVNLPKSHSASASTFSHANDTSPRHTGQRPEWQLSRRVLAVGLTYVADIDADSDEARTRRPLQAAACT